MRYFLWVLLLIGVYACGGSEEYSTITSMNISDSTKVKKVDIQYAHNFDIVDEQEGTRIRLKVGEKWQEYFLYQKSLGAAPSNCENMDCILIPIERVICTGTSHVAFLEALGLEDKIVGITNATYVYSPLIQDRIKKGDIIDLGSDQELDYEQILTLNPDLVFWQNMVGSDASSNKLSQLDIPQLPITEFLESTPLGRAEWVRLLGELFDRREEAETYFNKVAEDYENIKTASKTLRNKPTIMLGTAYEGIWYIPEGESFMADFIADAGGDYLWKDTKGSSSLSLDIEAVMTKALDADIWLNTPMITTYKDLALSNPYYTEFTPYKNKKVYHYSKRISELGGHDFFESGVVQPDLVLKDLQLILHDELIPSDSLYYYAPLAQ